MCSCIWASFIRKSPSRGVTLLQENPQKQVGGRRDCTILAQNLERAIEYDDARRKNVGALRLQSYDPLAIVELRL